MRLWFAFALDQSDKQAIKHRDTQNPSSGFLRPQRCRDERPRKEGIAVEITDVLKELKAAHNLSQQDVMSNLNYLLSQGWVKEDKVEKSVSLPSGTVIPNTTSYYQITAAGIGKIEGPGEFTMDKFRG